MFGLMYLYWGQNDLIINVTAADKFRNKVGPVVGQGGGRAVSSSARLGATSGKAKSRRVRSGGVVGSVKGKGRIC